MTARITLEGKVAIITGASRGIGEAIARAYAESGASVVLAARKPDALHQVAASIGERALAVPAHTGKESDCAAIVSKAIERFGKVDILVNNAATNPYFGPLLGVDMGAWDKTFEVNLRGLHVWTQEAWRTSMKEHGGSVINVASIGGMSIETSIGIYNVTKAAVIHLTRTMARELAPKVRVNAIAPGLVKTDMARALWEANEEGIAKMVPMKRLGEPEDIAHAATFLASDAASWITGDTLVVDGGMLLR